jgi:hypothetical protein
MADEKGTNTLAAQWAGWIGVISSVVTIFLTVWNVHIQTGINKSEQDIKARETDIHNRAENLQEATAKIARFTWVHTLFPELKSPNAQDRTLTLALIRLSLDPADAQTLFAGLAQSNDKDLKDAGQKGLQNLEREPFDDLIQRITGEQASDRKAALNRLVQDFKGSPATIDAVLRLFDDDNAARLSAPGAINALYYLANSDVTVWTPDQISRTRAALVRLRQRFPGPDTQKHITSVEGFLAKRPTI